MWRNKVAWRGLLTYVLLTVGSALVWATDAVVPYVVGTAMLFVGGWLLGRFVGQAMP
jgi:hypothetical protein